MNTRVSVVMASYNGEMFIEEQITSILINLEENDELIISDDGSTDNTLQIIKKIQAKDKRIKLINGPKKGIKQNFANGIKESHGKYIFLSDQDDIWSEDKVKTVVPYLEKYSVVVHDCKVFKDNLTILDSFFKYRNSGKGIIKNIYKNTYIGCCMAFHSELKNYILPIPNEIEMHDQWIGVIGEKHRKGCIFIPNKLISYRRHDDNASSLNHYKIPKMIKNRLIFIWKYLKRRKK